jgi:hypothetical protein
MTEMIPISPLLSVATITFAFSLGKISYYWIENAEDLCCHEFEMRATG